MYCPNCGKTNSTQQRFCRSCGLQLEKTVQSLGEQLPARELEQHLQDRQRIVERLLHLVGGTAVSIVAGGVLWGIIYEIMIVKGEVLAGSIFLAFIIGMILFALLAMYRESLAKASSRRQLSRSVEPRTEDTAKLSPESSVGSLASVTEHTTELLKAEITDNER